jgi:hypothetical protein
MERSKRVVSVVALAVMTAGLAIGCIPERRANPPITIVGSDVAACQSERADELLAHEAAHVLQQGGGSPQLRDFLKLPVVYFAPEDGLVTKPIARSAATLKKVPATACAPISNDEVPIGWP